MWNDIPREQEYTNGCKHLDCGYWSDGGTTSYAMGMYNIKAATDDDTITIGNGSSKKALCVARITEMWPVRLNICDASTKLQTQYFLRCSRMVGCYMETT